MKPKMLSMSNRPGEAPARRADEFVPEVGRATCSRVLTARLVAGGLLAPVLVAVAPVSDSVRRILYLGALVVVWSFIAHAVASRRAPLPVERDRRRDRPGRAR